MSRTILRNMVNGKALFEFEDVVPGGWALVPKTSGLEATWYFPENVALWRAADFVGGYVDMVLYYILLTIRHRGKPIPFWTYCLAELGPSFANDRMILWTPVECIVNRKVTEDYYEKLYHSRGWYPQSENPEGFIYSNPLLRKWVRVGIGREDHLVTHEPAAITDNKILAFPSSRPTPRPELRKRLRERIETWENGWSDSLFSYK